MGERENEELRSLPGENAQDKGHRRHPGSQHGSSREGPGAGMQGDSVQSQLSCSQAGSPRTSLKPPRDLTFLICKMVNRTMFFNLLKRQRNTRES